MSDVLFRGIVASSLAYNHVQNNRIIGELNRINDGIDDLGSSLDGVQQQVAKISEELQVAREQQRIQAFWRENIFLVKKGLDKALASVDKFPHRALYLAESFAAYMRQEGLNSRMFDSIADKEYWSTTCDIRDKVSRQAVARLPREEVEAVCKVVMIQQIRSPLVSLIAWKRAYPHLRAWWQTKKSLPSAHNFKRKIWLKIHYFFESLSKASQMVTLIFVILGTPTLILFLLAAAFNKDLRMGAIALIILGAIIVGMVILGLKSLEKFVKKIEHTLQFIPNVPEEAARVLEAADWQIPVTYSEHDWNVDAARFANEITALGLHVHENESVDSLQGLLRDFDGHMQTWQGRLLLS